MSNAEKLTEWQPIETAPKDATKALFYSPGNPKAWHARAKHPHIMVDGWNSGQGSGANTRWNELPEAPYTHWMPLPQPPKEAS